MIFLTLVFCFYAHVVLEVKKPPHVQVEQQTCSFPTANLQVFPTMTSSKKVPPNDCDNDRQPKIALWAGRPNHKIQIGLSGHIAISCCRSLSQSFGDTFFDVAVIRKLDFVT